MHLLLTHLPGYILRYTLYGTLSEFESSWSPADWLVMEMLVPRFCPRWRQPPLTALASIDPGMNMPPLPVIVIHGKFHGG